jgi:hypothetical protein
VERRTRTQYNPLSDRQLRKGRMSNAPNRRDAWTILPVRGDGRASKPSLGESRATPDPSSSVALR